MSGLGYNKIWDILKTYKLKHLINLTNQVAFLSCFGTDDANSVLDKSITANMSAFEIELGKYGSKHANYNIDQPYNLSKKSFEEGAKMFIYLSLCPKKFLFDWTQFYIDLFQKAPPDIMVQTLNRIIITATRKGDKTVKRIAIAFLEKMMNTFSLQFQNIGKLSRTRVQMDSGNQSNDIDPELSKGIY